MANTRAAGLGAALNPDRLWRHLEEFSHSVRTSGSPAERKAFQYAEGVLAKAGFDTRLIKHPAYISDPVFGQLVCRDRQIQAITHSLTPSTPVDGVRGVLTTSTADDLQGRVALTYGIAGPGAVQNLQHRGAIAAIFVNSEHTYEMCSSPVWGSPDFEDLAKLPQIPVISVLGSEAQYLEEAAARGQEVVVFTEVNTRWDEVPLLEATLDAPESDGSLVLFSGHIDSWHLGAMDNGGANATMLEVATVMAEHSDQMRRSLRMLFWSGHSNGRYSGSTWYADNHFEELRERALLHVNIDSVGGKGATVLANSPCMSETFELGARAIGAVSNQPYEGGRSERAGDQSFFGHGVSSLFMGLSEQPASNNVASHAFASMFGGGRTGGFGWWWHTVEDTIDKLDPRNLERDALVYLHAIHEACTSVLPPLQYSKTASEIGDHLRNYQEIAGDEVNLSRSIELSEKLATLLEELETSTHANPGRFGWKIFKELGTILVPLNYVRGSIFEHDPALPQPALPLLANVLRLRETVDMNSKQHLLVGITRSRNEVEEALRTAIAIASNALSS